MKTIGRNFYQRLKTVWETLEPTYDSLQTIVPNFEKFRQRADNSKKMNPVLARGVQLWKCDKHLDPIFRKLSLSSDNCEELYTNVRKLIRIRSAVKKSVPIRASLWYLCKFWSYFSKVVRNIASLEKTFYQLGKLDRILNPECDNLQPMERKLTWSCQC